MKPTEWPLQMVRGSKFELTVQVQAGGIPVDLTGWTAAVMTVTASGLDGATVLAIVPATIAVEEGQILVDIPSSVTAAYDWDWAPYRLEATDGTNVHRLLQGFITVIN